MASSATQWKATGPFPHFTSALHVVDYVKRKYPDVHLSFYDTSSGNHANLSMIDVPKRMQRQGVGSNIMKAINHYADSSGKTVTLTPEYRGYGQPSKFKLVQFYKQHGYRSNLGRKRDYRYSGTMIRVPTKSLEVRRPLD